MRDAPGLPASPGVWYKLALERTAAALLASLGARPAANGAERGRGAARRGTDAGLPSIGTICPPRSSTRSATGAASRGVVMDAIVGVMRTGGWTADGMILVIPAKRDQERDAVAEAWARRAGVVERLDRFWEPPPLDAHRVRLYGADTFCLVVAQKLGLDLLAPPDDLVRSVPPELLLRRVSVTTLAECLDEPFPQFVKPVVPKQFRASVWSDRAALERETQGLDPSTPVIQSEPVSIDAEARSFVLDGEVVTSAIYDGRGDDDAASSVVSAVARSMALPRTCVIDTCFIPGRGWAFLEANATWGAGLNGCDPDAVLPCIDAATTAVAHG